MAFPVAPDRIAAILGARASHVAAYWPLIESQLVKAGIYTQRVAIAALATVRVECGAGFAPIRELGSDAYLNAHYDTRKDLGNTPERDGDGAHYCGRGFIQITGKGNYFYFGKLLGVDLVANPEAALDPTIAAGILVAYFRLRGVAVAANKGDWTRVRELVNGGHNGLAEFLGFCAALEGAMYAASAAGVPANS